MQMLDVLILDFFILSFWTRCQWNSIHIQELVVKRNSIKYNVSIQPQIVQY